MVQELPGDGLSSKPSSDSISLTKMESRVSTTPKRYKFNICFMAERVPRLCRAVELPSASGRLLDPPGGRTGSGPLAVNSPSCRSREENQPTSSARSQSTRLSKDKNSGRSKTQSEAGPATYL